MSDETKRDEQEIPYLRAIPRPTPFPMVTAFGCALLFAGIVTHPAVSAMGALCALVGIVGWFREVFPHERMEEIPVPMCDIALPAPEFAPRVTRAKSPRRIVPEEMHPYRSGFYGGLVGAIAMAVVACMWGVVDERSIWMPINLLAGMLLPSVGAASEEALRSFNLVWTITSVCLHLAMSVMVGMIFVVALPMMPKRPMVAGGILAPMLWTGVAWATLHVVNPTLEQHISWGWFLGSQIGFGVACGSVITRFNRVRLQVGTSLAMRLEVEQTEGGSK
ncbi:MAG: hypothetical protein EXS10_01650 [Phycisphaerales bacterium]|nr:hypothetical protein [Phycisphaerales bacterium]